MSDTKSDLYPLFADVDRELNGEPYAVIGGVIIEASRTVENGEIVDIRALHAANMSLACTASGKHYLAILDLRANWTPIGGNAKADLEVDTFERVVREQAGL